MKRINKIVGIICTVLMISTVLCTGAAAYSPTISHFPIGVHFQPDTDQTTESRYQELENMNVNFILGTNELISHSTNDLALNKAAAHGIRILTYDYGFQNYGHVEKQLSTGGGWFVRMDKNIGQTFLSPVSGTGWSLRSITLKIDKQKWPKDAKIKLNVYDSPNKTTLLGSDTVSGTLDTIYPEFVLNIGDITASQTYYMEITTYSVWDIGEIKGSTDDSYSGGQAYSNGVAQNTDLYFEAAFYKQGDDFENNEYIDFVSGLYGKKFGFQGYYLKDQPSVKNMVELKYASDRFKANDPSHMSFVNLYPTYASSAQLGFDTMSSGDTVSSTQRLGQTFKTTSYETVISTVQWYTDLTTWGTGEALTLKVWDSPARNTMIAQSTLNSSTTNYPQFTLNASVNPNTTYYMELTHNGGGNNSIFVLKTPEDWDGDGSGYINGTAISGNYWYTVNQNISACSYDDYVYRWVRKQPDVLCFDHYPFFEDGSMRSDYFKNLEIIRNQSLLGKVDFWSYIQSVGVTGAYRTPSQNDLRYNIYTNLAYGCKGYIYYTYFTPPDFSWNSPYHDGLILPDGTKNTSYFWARNINSEVMKLGSSLMSLTSQAVYNTGTLPDSTTLLPTSFFWQPSDRNLPLVFGYFTNGSGRKFVMVVNRDSTNSRTVSFVLNTKPETVTEISKKIGNEVSTNYNYTTGTLSSDFAPGEGRLYALPAGY